MINSFLIFFMNIHLVLSMYFVKCIWTLTLVSQEIGRMEIKFYAFVIACFAKLLKLYIFKKYFPRCHAFLTNAVIFLILHRPHM